MESHQLHQQKIHKNCAAMESFVYGAEKVSTTNCRIFQVHLNRDRQAATTLSDAGHQKGIERLEHEIPQETSAKPKPFDILLQHHEQQLLQEVGTKATGAGNKFAKVLVPKKNAAQDKAYWAAPMTADKRLHFRICLSDAETEAMTWSLADTERVTNQLEREIYGITSNWQKRFKMEFCIHLIEFKAWWQTIGIQVLRKTIEQHVIHFGNPMMHRVSHLSVSIHWMGSADNFTTDISEQLPIGNVKEAYQSSNKVNYIRQILKHKDRCTSPDYMEETLSYLVLEGWYDIDSA